MPRPALWSDSHPADGSASPTPTRASAESAARPEASELRVVGRATFQVNYPDEPAGFPFAIHLATERTARPQRKPSFLTGNHNS